MRIRFAVNETLTGVATRADAGGRAKRLGPVGRITAGRANDEQPSSQPDRAVRLTPTILSTITLALGPTGHDWSRNFRPQ